LYLDPKVATRPTKFCVRPVCPRRSEAYCWRLSENGVAGIGGARNGEDQPWSIPRMVPAGHHESDSRRNVAIARGGLAALLVAAAIGCGPAIAAEHSGPPHRDQSASRNMPPRSPAPTVIEIQPSAQEVEAVAEQEATRRLLGLEPDAWVAIFTGALTVATGLLWLATERTIGQAREHSERELRAYVSVFSTEANGGFDGNPSLFFCQIDTVNVGRTPAKNVVIRMSMDILPYPLLLPPRPPIRWVSRSPLRFGPTNRSAPV